MVTSKKLLLILILLITSIAKADIIEVDSLDKIKQDFEKNYNKNYLPQDLLVVVDLDKLLFKSLLPAGEKFNSDAYSNLLPALKRISQRP